uniref:hypothetical protein n=1 Tax=Serratia TaxID=613 RepID=UPI001F4BDCB5|nr:MULTISPECIES: hypothetical protein [Serratia]ULG12114.1 hypothetical protein D1p1_00082 [Serratia entomophila]ULG12372.1 hypothetical protein M3p_00076 [Serratia entomophila]ULG16038.1 hypothetical protein 591p_00188 [Serratia proteamaculans]ULG18409.1 hypothetical protein Man4p_00092 [Serratia proteamaculans]ULG19616.1 hypothetical protein S-prot-1p1_00031 [Serratia proteamaculans]
MGREVRRVPRDWQHPKNDNGEYLPLFDGAKYQKRVSRWDEEAERWSEGFWTDSNGMLVPLTEEQKGASYSLWNGERPDPKDFMPLWPDEERTHFMMYEDATEGTPVSE